jgi:hypothetical protein
MCGESIVFAIIILALTSPVWGIMLMGIIGVIKGTLVFDDKNNK